MTNKTLTVNASSPDELSVQLSQLSLMETAQYKYVALSISGPDVLVQPFNIPNIKIKDIKTRLQMVSVELLNLPADQIAFDYQIFSSKDGSVCGVFTCAPKSLINRYNKVVQDSGFEVIRITAYILTSINAFYQDHPEVSHRFCLLDFSRDGYINLAVMHDLKFELLRKVAYDNFSEALFEIKQSLRSACAKSTVKHFDHIYFSGDIPEQDRIINEIQTTFDSQSHYKDAQDVKRAQNSQHALFSINLAREHVVSDEVRGYLLHGFTALVGILMVICLWSTFSIHQSSQRIHQALERGEAQSYVHQTKN